VINLNWDSNFKNSYKKRIRNRPILKNKFWDALEIFSHNPFDSRLATHKLTGKLDGFWSFSVDDNCRVIFKFYDKDKTVLLIDIGSHKEVY
jgi:mRNA interferase YafQ